MAMLLEEQVQDLSDWVGDGVWDGDQESALNAYRQLQDQRDNR